MAEQANAEQKPGMGIDRTLIRRMLLMTPADRLKTLVDEARNVSELFAKMRPR
jgi:hypothetical protein